MFPPSLSVELSVPEAHDPALGLFRPYRLGANTHHHASLPRSGSRAGRPVGVGVADGSVKWPLTLPERISPAELDKPITAR